MINSVCLCVTFKCDLECRHCFVSAGPNRTDEMTYPQLRLAIDNSYNNVHRMYFSGGEPTYDFDKLVFGLCYAKNKREIYGFPQNICVQTNGNFAKTKNEALDKLKALYENGVNEIDISSADMYHSEQMERRTFRMIAKTAREMDVFDKITIGGSGNKIVKRFGRAKDLPADDILLFNKEIKRQCVYTGTDFVVYTNGDVLSCIYGFKHIIGNLYENSLDEILTNESTVNLLRFQHGIKDNEQTGRHKDFFDRLHSEDEEICKLCNEFTANI